MNFLKKNKYYIGLLALFALQFIFINPIGEFALNDDWVHTEILKHLVDTGEFRMMPFAGPTFYIPILYGAILVKLFGFSFTLLRLSTLLFAIVGLLLFFVLAKKIIKKTPLAFLITLLLWFNPLFYNLSFTFMTDIPALTIMLLSFYFYYRAFEEQNYTFLFYGSLIAALGFFIRQTNILVLPAAGLYAFFFDSYFKYKWKTIWAFVLPGLSAVATYLLLGFVNLLPQNTDEHVVQGFSRFIGHIKWWIFYTFMYIGLFSLPLTFSWIIKQKNTLKNTTLLISIGIFTVGAIAIREILALQFPYVGNIVSLYGLGPMNSVLQGDLTPLVPSIVWGGITVLAAIGAGLLVYIIITYKTNFKLLPHKSYFLLIFLGIYLMPILLFESFDRYLLPVLTISFLCIGYLLAKQNYSKYILIASILISALYSISQTHFYLAWNNARWDMANNIKNTPIEDIDAGYEWDGWHQYWLMYDPEYVPENPKALPWWITKLFSQNTETYIVSFSPLDDYEILSKKIIKALNKNNTLYLLKKK